MVGGRVAGDGAAVVVGVRALNTAGPQHLSFLANRRYTPTARGTAAGAVLVGPDVDLGDTATVVVEDPYRAFAQVMQHFHPAEVPEPRIDPLAQVASDAVVSGARVDAFAWVGSGAQVGPGTWLQSGAYVGAGAVVGRGCRLMPNAVVMDGCEIGERVWLNPGAVVGSDGFGFAPGPTGHLKIPQVGQVTLGDDVEVGANSCIDRAALDHTRVGSGSKLDNLVQVGHGAELGADCLMVAYSGVAGSASLGRGVVLAAKAAVLGHLSVGDGTRVGVASVVTASVEANRAVSGVPAIEHRRWRRAVTAFSELDQLTKQVRRLEKRLKDLEERQP